MEELLKTFNVPDNTKMEEHSIVVDGGIIIGNHSQISFGVIADSIIAGEGVRINGNVIGSDDIRIDMWSQVGGDIRTRKDAYIGEFVNIDGKLIVKGDLDIAKDVTIGGGFEARGWIVVRNPIPVVIFIFLYLTELLRMGKSEEVEKAINELFEDDTADMDGERLLIIPGGSKIDLDSIRVPDKAVIGSTCRLMGNIRAASLTMNNNNTLFGSIRTMDGINVGEGNTIHGNLVTRGDVRIKKGTHILGEINGRKIFIHEDARVDGAMRASQGVIISRDGMDEAPVIGGILDLVPEPVRSQVIPPVIKAAVETTAEVEKAPQAKKSTVSKAAATKKSTALKKSGKKVRSSTQEKRSITAIRLSDAARPASLKKKTAARKTTRKKTPAKKTPAAKGSKSGARKKPKT